jgi:hypothetical protein
LEREGILTTQERRELGGKSDTKGLPKTRIDAAKAQMEHWNEMLETENDSDRRQNLQKWVDVTKRVVDDVRLEMGQQPETEERKHMLREKVREDIRTKFESFRRWAKENLGALADIAISIAGIITTVVVAGKKTIVRASN